jgi:hypothetical protein
VVVSVAELLLAFLSAPLAPSSAIAAVFESFETLFGTDEFTVTANVTAPVALGPTGPTANEHVVPARLPFAHDHPDVLAAASNVEFAGTISVITTPLAP